MDDFNHHRDILLGNKNIHKNSKTNGARNACYTLQIFSLLTKWSKRRIYPQLRASYLVLELDSPNLTKKCQKQKFIWLIIAYKTSIISLKINVIPFPRAIYKTLDSGNWFIKQIGMQWEIN